MNISHTQCRNGCLLPFFVLLFSGFLLNKNKNKFFPVFALGIVFPLLLSSPASAECQAFPKLEIWRDMTHTSVRNYVETKFDGEWDVYIEKLERIRKGLERIQQRGKGAVVRLKGRSITLRDEKLGNYIQLSGERMDVVRCLAEQAEFSDLQNFTTAAGGNAQDNSSDFPSSGESRDDYRTFVTLPQSLVVELRKQATRRSLIENHKVSVNDIITRSLRKQYTK